MSLVFHCFFIPAFSCVGLPFFQLSFSMDYSLIILTIVVTLMLTILRMGLYIVILILKWQPGFFENWCCFRKLGSCLWFGLVWFGLFGLFGLFVGWLLNLVLPIFGCNWRLLPRYPPDLVNHDIETDVAEIEDLDTISSNILHVLGAFIFTFSFLSLPLFPWPPVSFLPFPYIPFPSLSSRPVPSLPFLSIR